MNGLNVPPRRCYHPAIRTIIVTVVAAALCHSARAANLTAGMAVMNPNTAHYMLVAGYDDGTLEFRDGQGTLLQVRYGFGEITALSDWRSTTSALPLLIVCSTDSGGAIRVIDPSNINTDVAARFGFGRITALYSWYTGRIYTGSTDSGGALRRLNGATLADDAVRYGFGQITAIFDGWDTTSAFFLLVGSTDSGGTMRCVHPQTLVDVKTPRYGFGTIYGFFSGDADGDNCTETVIASSDGGGTIRFVEAPNLATDLATRQGFGTISHVGYGPVGVTQCDNEGQAGSKYSIVATSSDGNGAVWLMEVDANTLTTTLADAAGPRYGFGTIGIMGLARDYYKTLVDVIAVLCTDGGSLAGHTMDENLTDLRSFSIP